MARHKRFGSSCHSTVGYTPVSKTLRASVVEALAPDDHSSIQRKPTMQITVNEEPIEVPEGMTIAELLVKLGKDPKFLAVERNLELVPRRTHSDVALESGDRIEIVTLVGGG